MTEGDLSAYGLAAFLGTAGATHFLKPDFYDPIVPRALPGEARTWTYVSGAAELTVAALVANRSTRWIGSMLAAGLFVAVFPGNIQMAWDWRDQVRTRAGRRVRPPALAGSDGLVGGARGQARHARAVRSAPAPLRRGPGRSGPDRVGGESLQRRARSTGRCAAGRCRSSPGHGAGRAPDSSLPGSHPPTSRARSGSPRRGRVSRTTCRPLRQARRAAPRRASPDRRSGGRRAGVSLPRSRFASIRNSGCINSGCCASHSLNSTPETATSSLSSTVTALAERGSPSIADSSPSSCPRSRCARVTSRPPRVVE